MQLPPNHPQRVELNDEVHARPPEALVAPVRLSFLALLSNPQMREQNFHLVSDLASRYGAKPPVMDGNHYSADFKAFRIKWERHTEFTRYKFIAPLDDESDPFAKPAITLVPEDFLKALPGQLLVAAHSAVVRANVIEQDYDALGKRLFAGNVLIGSTVAGGAARAFTDFRIHADGFSRVLVEDTSMTPRQTGRIMQRLFEIDTYRIMALLTLPVARELSPFLTEGERELSEITTAMIGASSSDEPMLLDRLTRLEASIESRQSANHYRFSAAAAYYDLVQRRIAELREERIEGLQTFGEFTERRLAPAMNTCTAAAARQHGLAERVARATQLLSTRVDITHERQNQALLESMNKRAQMQLRLQETVEGLSVAAVTYYIVGLVGYAAKGIQTSGYGINPDLAMGISIPFVVLFTALGVRRIRRMISN